jgi:hypothetical protein
MAGRTTVVGATALARVAVAWFSLLHHFPPIVGAATLARVVAGAPAIMRAATLARIAVAGGADGDDPRAGKDWVDYVIEVGRHDL